MEEDDVPGAGVVAGALAAEETETKSVRHSFEFASQNGSKRDGRIKLCNI